MDACIKGASGDRNLLIILILNTSYAAFTRSNCRTDRLGRPVGSNQTCRIHRTGRSDSWIVWTVIWPVGPTGGTDYANDVPQLANPTGRTNHVASSNDVHFRLSALTDYRLPDVCKCRSPNQPIKSTYNHDALNDVIFLSARVKRNYIIFSGTLRSQSMKRCMYRWCYSVDGAIYYFLNNSLLLVECE